MTAEGWLGLRRLRKPRAKGGAVRGGQSHMWEESERHLLVNAWPWLRVSVLSLRAADGRVIPDFYQVELPEYVGVVALDEEKRLVMVRQYKHAIRDLVLTIPAGFIEEDETPLAAAWRELREETGYECTDWRPLGSFAVDGNRGCGRAHLFFASGGRRVCEPDLADELEEIEVVLLPRAEAMSALRQGRIPLLGGAAALALAALHGFLYSSASDAI